MNQYDTKGKVLEKAKDILHKSLREIIPAAEIKLIEAKIREYKNKRKGYLGELIEWYLFDKKADSLSQADFSVAGVELKATPLKRHVKKSYVSKERLVFSMIDYDKVVEETWLRSSFLAKNRVVLLMFYLWVRNESILDYEFKFNYLLDLLNGLSEHDVYQIQKDWEFIVAKIKRGQAHLLSEGDTYYLGACTKAANSRVLRDQPRNRVKAKPRAFSLKQQYLNYLIQKNLLGKDVDTESIFKKKRRVETVEEAMQEIFAPYIGKTDKEILAMLGIGINKKTKHYKRLIADAIIGIHANKIEELEKANVIAKALTLEHTGTLKESISFPAFSYKELVNELWIDEEEETMADFHLMLETRKFFFIIFQKRKGSDEIVLKKIMFWNFPAEDLLAARDVWEATISCINEGRVIKEIRQEKGGKSRVFTHFPGSTFNGVAHVRPHGADSKDMIELPVADILTGRKEHTKQCFWLNASYIQKAIESGRDQA